MGVILIIIYIYNNFIWVGEGYSFSMLQMFCLLQSEKSAFCRIFRHSFPRKSGTFAPNFKARWNNENNENNEKLRKKLWVSLSSGSATKA